MAEKTKKPLLRRLLRWALICTLLFFFLGAAGFTTIYAMSSSRLSKTYDVTPAPVDIPEGDAREIARGRYLSSAVMGCTDCHGDNFGGKVIMDQFPVGTLAGPNLTRGKGSKTLDFDNTDWVRAIRHGVAPDGHALVLMPSADYYEFGDDDLGAIIAYIKALPPIDNETPEPSLGPLLRTLLVADEFKLDADRIDHKAKRPLCPPRGPTREYGKVLVSVCRGCHGDTFSGGKIGGAPPDWPQARNITPDKETGIGQWTFDDFKRAIRTGKRPNGDTLSEVMPYKFYKDMSDDDLTALWLFLKTVEPKPAGNK